MHKCGGRWRAGGVAADGWGKGVVLSIAACYHPPQLGDSLINAAFLQLTSKVTGIVGTQPLPFAAAPEEGNGHIIHFPRGFFPPFPPFSPSALNPYSRIFSYVCLFVRPLDLSALSLHVICLILSHICLSVPV